MSELRKLEYFLLRYVPDAVKGEFVNIGLMMMEAGDGADGFADVRFARDWRRAKCLDPQIDVEMLEAMEREIRGQLKVGEDRAVLLRRLQDSFSNTIELSPARGCLAEDPVRELETMAGLYLESNSKAGVARELSGRQGILAQMRSAFDAAGVSKLVMSGIPAAQYTRAGDPFKFDFGYRVGDEVKLFHAVSLKASVEAAVTLAARYPKIVEGAAQKIKVHANLTAVIDDDLDRKREEVQFALGLMAEESIRIAGVAEMPVIAEMARVELRA